MFMTSLSFNIRLHMNLSTESLKSSNLLQKQDIAIFRLIVTNKHTLIMINYLLIRTFRYFFCTISKKE